MTNYRSLVGQKIKKVSSDPSNPLEGQIWYNTTSGTLKGDCPKPNLNISFPCNSRSLESSLILKVDEGFKFFTISFII